MKKRTSERNRLTTVAPVVNALLFNVRLIILNILPINNSSIKKGTNYVWKNHERPLASVYQQAQLNNQCHYLDERAELILKH